MIADASEPHNPVGVGMFSGRFPGVGIRSSRQPRAIVPEPRWGSRNRGGLFLEGGWRGGTAFRAPFAPAGLGRAGRLAVPARIGLRRDVVSR